MIYRRNILSAAASASAVLACPSLTRAATSPASEQAISMMTDAERKTFRNAILHDAQAYSLDVAPVGAAAADVPEPGSPLQLAAIINRALYKDSKPGSIKVADRAASLLAYENALLQDPPPTPRGPVGASGAQSVTLTATTRKAYLDQFANAKVRTPHPGEKGNFAAEIASAVTLILDERAKREYIAVQQLSTVPWYVIAALHYRECSLNFLAHLHNGDPLMTKTRHVPAGRPPEWLPHVDNNINEPLITDPVLLWRLSAVDALKIGIQKKVSVWAVAELCFGLECYNGIGYFYHRPTQSPYLWNYSQYYNCPPSYPGGGYRSDHNWDPNYVSQQAGLAMIIKELQGRVRDEVHLPT